MVEDVVTPSGPYRLALMCRSGTWNGALPGGAQAVAWQQRDGRVALRAPTEDGLAHARFMLALDDDTSEFHARFAGDALLGPTVRALRGYRPLRLATVAHAALRAMCGQLIESGRAAAIERSILRELGVGRRNPGRPPRPHRGRAPPARARDVACVDAPPPRPLDRPRAAPHARHRGRAPAPRPGARHRPVVGRGDRDSRASAATTTGSSATWGSSSSSPRCAASGSRPSRRRSCSRRTRSGRASRGCSSCWAGRAG